MVSLIPSIAALLVGMVFLAYSADRFVDSARLVAIRLGISSLVVGITIVGFGTSVPEMIVSSIAAWQNSPGIAVGNALGSNIANIALILGFTALFAPIHCSREVIRREYPILLGLTLFVSAMMLNGRLDRWEGVLFFFLQVVLLWVSVTLSRRQRAALPSTDEPIPEAPHAPDAPSSSRPMWKETIRMLSFFTVLVVSSRMLVWGAVNLAEYAGISDLIIGLTVIAVGTSLPELAASLAASRQGLSDMVLGNVLGSNSFNLLSVLGISAVVRPQILDIEVLTRDLPVMLGLTVLLGLFLLGRRGLGSIHRGKGVILLVFYASYQAFLYFSAVNPS